MRLPVVPALISALLAAGCAGVNPVPTTVAIPGMPNPEEALRQSMQHVDAEMAELGQLSPTVARQLQPVMPADLQRIVSFEWNGPLDQAVAKLAASIGYTFYTTAPANAQPLDGLDPNGLGARLSGLSVPRRGGGNPRDRSGRSAAPPGPGDPPCLGSARLLAAVIVAAGLRLRADKRQGR